MKVFASIYPKKLALLAITGALAIITACVVPVTAASASAAHPSTAAVTSANAVVVPCGSNTPINNIQFFRCTTNTQTGSLVAGDCNIGQNYNVNNAPFNVYAAYNYCFVRVWLHQATNWQQGGWAYCINPKDLGPYQETPAQFQHPDNIYISSNEDGCP